MPSHSFNEHSGQVKVVKSWAAAFNSQDFIGIANLLSDKYVHEVLPKSFGAPSMKRTNGWHFNEILRRYLVLVRKYSIAMMYRWD